MAQELQVMVITRVVYPDNKSCCRHLIVDAYDEPHLLEFYQRNDLNLFFSSLEQEIQYRNWDVEKDGR